MILILFGPRWHGAEARIFPNRPGDPELASQPRLHARRPSDESLDQIEGRAKLSRAQRERGRVMRSVVAHGSPAVDLRIVCSRIGFGVGTRAPNSCGVRADRPVAAPLDAMALAQVLEVQLNRSTRGYRSSGAPWIALVQEATSHVNEVQLSLGLGLVGQALNDISVGYFVARALKDLPQLGSVLGIVDVLVACSSVLPHSNETNNEWAVAPEDAQESGLGPSEPAQCCRSVVPAETGFVDDLAGPEPARLDLRTPCPVLALEAVERRQQAIEPREDFVSLHSLRRTAAVARAKPAFDLAGVFRG